MGWELDEQSSQEDNKLVLFWDSQKREKTQLRNSDTEETVGGMESTENKSQKYVKASGLMCEFW